MSLSKDAQKLLADIRTRVMKKALANNWSDEKTQTEVRKETQSFLNSDEARGFSKDDRIAIHKANNTDSFAQEMKNLEMEIKQTISEKTSKKIEIEQKVEEQSPIPESPRVVTIISNLKKWLTLSIILRLVCSIMLVWSLSRHKYDFYVILRWLVTCTSAYCASLANRMKNQSWLVIFVAVAILFNPIAPIKLSRGMWTNIDLGVALLLLVSLKFVNETKVDA